MSFHEVVFPVTISFDSDGGPGYNTEALDQGSGQETRIARWEDSRRKYDAATGLKSIADMALVLDFFHARKGSLHGFLWKDWSDYSSAADHVSTPAGDDETIGTGDGVTTGFQLIKTYTSGGTTTTRTIEKPVVSTTIIRVAGVSKTDGVDYTVNVTTGVVTFASAPAAAAAITAGFYFYVPVRFGSEVDKLMGITLSDFDNRQAKALPVQEIKSTRWVDDERYYGGSFSRTVSAPLTLSESDARVQLIDALSGATCKLPDPASLPAGGEWFYIYNIGAAAFNLLDWSGSLLLSVPAGTGVTVVLGLDISGNPLWIAF